MEPTDRVTELLIEALAAALARPGEHRLFRSGKLDGLFPGRTAVCVASADQALRDGLLERVRVETKGKTEIEWVRIAPPGVEFLHQHESAVQGLRNLHAALQSNRAGLPVWLAEMTGVLREAETRLAASAADWEQRLAAIEHRVSDTLRRLEAASPLVPPEVLQAHPWTVDALNYLDHRRTVGATTDCPLPELFDAVVAHHPALTLNDFRDGLRRLHQRRALRLRPAEPAEEVARPEYALLDEAGVCYYAVR
jgi:hypothetical protein